MSHITNETTTVNSTGAIHLVCNTKILALNSNQSTIEFSADPQRLAQFESKMAEDFPFKAEYAKSNRSSCKLCRENIAKDSLRVAKMVQVIEFLEV